MRYLILGASEAHDEAGRPLPLGGQRLRALLAALALRAGSSAPVSPETLISEVWADTESDTMPDNAPAALQALVGRLRKVIGKDAILSFPGGYRLRTDPEADEVDLLRFEGLVAQGERALEDGDPGTAAEVLREALALWRGPALADLPDRASPAARAEALRQTALHRRFTADLALGRAAHILPELRELTAERPLDEPLQALFIRALRDSGRSAEALTVYESVRKDIANRLGADPGPELRALHVQLLAANMDGAALWGLSGPSNRPHTRPGAGGPPRGGPPRGGSARGGSAPGGYASEPVRDGTENSPVRDGTENVPVRGGPTHAPAEGAADGPPRDGPVDDRAHGGSTDDLPHDDSVSGPAPGSSGNGHVPDDALSGPAREGVANASGPSRGGPVPSGPVPSGPGEGSPRPTRPPGNLRARLTSFVGRESDLATIGGDLSGSRLVTLTGPGGSGKTRLAEQVAAMAGASELTPYPDGTWMVELAPLDHPAALPGAVLSALGRRETALSTAATEGTRSHPGDTDATALLVEHLEHRRPLLVLDNCEHLIDAAATLAETLLAHCPGLTVVATSREPLGVPGETVRPVEPLPPASAHRLFADRGAVARPGFRTGEDPEAVAEICRRLDGLPLAIELAAARLRSLTPRQIADRLDDRFRLLTSGSRTVLPRQQTLRAVVDWSWDLLDERERTVVRRLSVFAGGCTLSAAEHVCADGSLPQRTQPGGAQPGGTASGGTASGGSTSRGTASGDGDGDTDSVSADDVLDLLSALVDKSILVPDPPPALSGTGMRYRMLETIHDYARERAVEHPADRAAAEARHTEQILRFVTAAEPRIRSAEQLTWLPRIEADLDNVRAALHRCFQRRDRDTLVTLVHSVGWFWWLRNYRDEGAHWVAAVLSLLPDAAEEREEEEETLFREFQFLEYFLMSEHYTQELLADPERQAVAAELVEAFKKPGPVTARFPGLLWPFIESLPEGSKGVAALMDDSVANCRRYSAPWELAVALLFRSHVRIGTPGGLHRTTEDLVEVTALAESTGDRWLLSQVCGLRAEIAIQEGRYDDARAECETALRYAQQLGALTEIPILLTRIADIWFRRGDTAQADKLARRAIEDADRLGVRDAQTLGMFLRAVAAAEDGRIAQAREMYVRSRAYASVGTPPAMFEIMMRTLDARITASEGDGGPREAIRKIRTALRIGLEVEVAEIVLNTGLLTAGYILHLDGRHELAVRCADAARALRGGLPASVPELRIDGTIRAYAAAGLPGGAPPARETPLTPGEVLAHLEAVCTELADDER